MSWKNVRRRWTKCLQLTGEKIIETRERKSNKNTTLGIAINHAMYKHTHWN